MISSFGTLPDGDVVTGVRIGGDRLRATILSWGATIQDLRFGPSSNQGDAPLVLGFETIDDYLVHGRFHGATVGRVINQIGGASAKVSGKLHKFDSNSEGGHTLHGGTAGYGSRNWQILDYGPAHASFSLTDADGHMGFPGTVRATCSYSITMRGDDPALRVELAATTDAPTLVNMGHHSYFCLDDRGDIRGHELRIDAGRYLPCDETALRTGVVAAVGGTRFDFRARKPVGGAFDHHFCLANRRREITRVAELVSPVSGLSMQLRTTEPGLQLYTGQGLAGGGSGHSGHGNGPFAGICLEPQAWPDAPNNASFPSIDLAPGDRYLQVSEFAFSRG